MQRPLAGFWIGLVIIQASTPGDGGGRRSNRLHLQPPQDDAVTRGPALAAAQRQHWRVHLARKREPACLFALRGGSGGSSHLSSSLGTVRLCPAGFEDLDSQDVPASSTPCFSRSTSCRISHLHIPLRGGGNDRDRRMPSAPPLLSSAAMSPCHSGQRGWDSKNSATHADLRQQYRTAADRGGKHSEKLRTTFLNPRISLSLRDRISAGLTIKSNSGAGLSETRGTVALSARGGEYAADERGGGGSAGVGTGGWRDTGVRNMGGDRWRLRVPPPVDGEGHISADVKVIDRFQVIQLLDRGTFGTVFRAWDPKWRQYVALKVVRKVEHYVQDAEFEVAILEEVAQLDVRSSHTVQLFKFFHYHGHLCIVTELLGASLHAVLKQHRQRRAPIRMAVIRVISQQLLQALAFLRSIRLVHADLKTENILLGVPGMNLDMPEDKIFVKLIDFGGATWEHDAHPRVVQTRHYRSPEVILGLSWTYPCDMWSLACILLELYEGRLTFDTRETRQHLAMIERISGGAIPPHLVKRIPRNSETAALFDPISGKVRWPELAQSQEEEDAVKAVEAVCERVDARDSSFRNLLMAMFQVDPDKRITPHEALCSPFLSAS